MALPILLAGASVPARADCTCRAFGKDHELGATVCLRLDGRSVVARCEMALNNTSWVPKNVPCPTAELGRPMTVAGLAPLPPGHPDVDDEAADEH
jgi:hypothetical protein